MSEDLRIAVIGAGRMGSDHIERIHHRMERARIAAIVDIDETRARAAVEGIDGARVYTDFTEAIASGEVDAVLISTPGFLHEDVLLPTITQGLPILCEKPLTPDSASAWRVVQAESAIGRKLIQVGFMRRFDAGYQRIQQAVASGERGELLALDCEQISTPGFLHEDVLLPTITQGLPILCEKPLTPDSASAWRVVQAESAIGRKLIQVGFMRRFDAGYQRIQQAVASGEHGELLALDCEHINPGVPAGYTGSNLIDDTVVHEFDGVRFLTGEEIASVQVRTGKNSCHVTTEGLQDPAQILMDTGSGVRVSVNTHVTAQYGYAVTTRASFEKIHLNEGVDQVYPGFEERFVDAYDTEVQDWIDGCLRGEVAGPDAWDGYAGAACCEAGLRAVAEPGTTVAVELEQKPELYR